MGQMGKKLFWNWEAGLEVPAEVRLEHIPVLCSVCHGPGALLSRAQRGQRFPRAVSRHKEAPEHWHWAGLEAHSTAMGSRALGQVAANPSGFLRCGGSLSNLGPVFPEQAGSAAGILTVHGTSPPLNFNPEGGINTVHPLCCLVFNLCRWSQGAEASSEPGFEAHFPGAGPSFAHFHNPP